jgi:TonB family protein
MQTSAARWMIVLCLICLGVPAGAGPQDQPELKKKVEPWYPTILKEAGIEGTVWLKVLIDEKGYVAKAETLKADHPGFAEAAIAAVKQWEFSPAMKDGKPIKSEVTIPFRFKLADGSLKSKGEDVIRLRDDVHKLLCGEARDKVQCQIGADAYVVVGAKQEHLAALLADKAARDLLVEGPDSKIETSRTVVSNAGDMAYLVLKTRPAPGKGERYHTVIFAKSTDGKWTITAWQAGP